MANNTMEQIDEIEALFSIYDTQWKIGSADGSYSIEVVPNVHLFITLHSNYPSNAPPIFELLAPIFSYNQKKKVTEEFNNIFQENLGGPVIFQWIEKLKEIANENVDNDTIDETNLNVTLSNTDGNNLNKPEFNLLVTHGETILDRRSVFQGHACCVKTAADTKMFLNYLLENKKIAQATHNISAYRIQTEKGVLLQDCDDDGETHAGGRVLHLLQILNATNVMVVVTRWYGGIQLGPDRFKHINNAARQVLVQGGFISQ